MSAQLPLITVGIPTYNRPNGLRRSLTSFTQQTYQNLEILVSDNCSTGTETEAIVREFMEKDARVCYFRQEVNVGAFKNEHFLFDRARGEYFMWGSDDDEWDADYITTCLESFDKSEKVVLVNTVSEVLAHDSDRVVKCDLGCTTLGLSPLRRYQRYLTTIFTEQAAVGNLVYGLFKTSSLRAVMPQENILSWDHVLLAQLALMGEFYTVDKVLMRSRLGGASKTVNNAAKAQCIEGSLSEKHPWWVREIYLQRIIRNAPNLSEFSKTQLSLWSYGYYLTQYGIKGFIKERLTSLYELYQLVRYREIRQKKQIVLK